MGTLHGEWRLNLHTSACQPLGLLAHFSCNLLYFKDFKTPTITQFGVLANQTQHMDSDKVKFTPRLIRYGPPGWHF
jgi:hypothetical protein